MMKVKKLMQRMMLILFGLVIFLLLLELSLRLSGLIISAPQKYGNRGGIGSEYRILAIGESTTAGGERTWPYHLERILNERSDKIRFRVFNEGVIGTRTAFILFRLSGQLDKYILTWLSA